MKHTILRLIAKHDGKLSWYELDRALIFHGIDPSMLGDMMPTLKQLEQSGLITATGEGAQPHYWITESGRKLLEQQEQEVTA